MRTQLTAADYQSQLSPASYFGMGGWWSFPQRGNAAWYAYTDRQGQIWVSPRADFTVLRYAAKINYDGYLVVYDQLMNVKSGYANGGVRGGVYADMARKAANYELFPTPEISDGFKLVDPTTGFIYLVDIYDQEIRIQLNGLGEYPDKRFVNLLDATTGGVQALTVFNGGLTLTQPDASWGYYAEIPLYDQADDSELAIILQDGQLTIQ